MRFNRWIRASHLERAEAIGGAFSEEEYRCRYEVYVSRLRWRWGRRLNDDRRLRLLHPKIRISEAL